MFTHCILGTLPLFYVGLDNFSFKGRPVYSVAFILFLVENPVSKQCRP